MMGIDVSYKYEGYNVYTMNELDKTRENQSFNFKVYL